MTHWLAISNRSNSEIVIKKNIWGVSNKYLLKISQVKPGDSLLLYTGQQMVEKELIPPKITAVFEITSNFYEDQSKIFTSPLKLGDEIFPYRIHLKLIKIFKPPVDFKSLIPKLNFITNKKMWTGHIRGKAMRSIPEDDYQFIISYD
ncbi:MAG: EVE domain-containing protein [Methanomicrobiales archaeon]